ncbi:sulfotransferase family 2 domain-containing protein [Sulfitobacter sp. F26169L]|uniref:sulfotransferase family 2 domain-containing protein n=1 Tax=Sulfitobacter sp. F26169L TaxID=2996015 RepID=UPI0022609FA1|nr:sulfotransferase family 2 domain-containing protein [Sulfitobacter sp. F26169L]MCX7567034.1 sulfotransferase family 2 domain-containing protein [Sulfitobacter sp. F26169L]
MILSRGRGYLFVHAPKTGGTSMALALEARAMKDDIMLGDTPKAIKRRKRLKGVTATGRLWKHATLADLEGLVNIDELDDLFVFTMVRNPWDRMVSYYHWLRGQHFDHPAVILAKQSTFAAFVAAPSIADSFSRAPAASYVTDSGGRERANLFIRLEHLAEDINPLQSHLGFDLDVPHVNQSTRAADYRAAYTDTSREQVEMMCAEDIARFGYRFEP